MTFSPVDREVMEDVFKIDIGGCAGMVTIVWSTDELAAALRDESVRKLNKGEPQKGGQKHQG